MDRRTLEFAINSEAMAAGTPTLIVEEILRRKIYGRVGVVSSFGAESAVLLHLVASVNKRTPILFVDTGKIFGETLRYVETLRGVLGLEDLRVIKPDALAVAACDPIGDLWRRDSGACCEVRKVAPLSLALEGFDTWMTGRKRFQSVVRESLPTVELTDGRLKINPLAAWSRRQIETYFIENDLPKHPLEADGFLSIGCFTCTDRVAPGEDGRAGRWRGLAKTECGIHGPASATAGRLPSA